MTNNTEVLLLNGCKTVIPVYFLCALLSIIVPGKTIEGYACDRRGKPLQYKMNGLFVMLLVTTGWFTICFHLQMAKITDIAENFWGCLFVAFILGISGSVILYIIGSNLDEHMKEKYSRCSTADRPNTIPKPSKEDLQDWENRSLISHFFLGQEFNPRLGPLDIKMYLYQVGATYLLLNLLSAAALQMEKDDGKLSIAMGVYAWMMTWFLCEYMWFEEIHLYTYDLFAEKLGFKLFWGCFCFYPFFYCIGVWSIINHKSNVDLNKHQMLGILVLFYAGWALTRGSNLQKFWFKTNKLRRGGNNNDSNTCFFGLIKQKTVQNHILCSGFWGLSRHINYLGETIQAVALALPGYLVSGSLVPFLYPLYYIALFVPRANDDGKICSHKYGEEWNEYVKIVPYKIVPFIY